ncbi:ADP-ribosylglycohydrolase family protein [Halanaerobium hydrogeniformans]|nr:ADP-ribosylglycohydrolase family protein [Halanaerobium hydrogeniformans]
MDKNRLSAIYLSLIGDAISLGSHWVYDTDKAKKHFPGRITEYTSPEIAKFHQGKKAGDFTHYGEQSFALLKSIYNNEGFELEKFREDWMEYIQENEMFMDHSMKDALQKFKGSDSLVGTENVELGGLARSAPMFLDNSISKEDFLAQIHLTHNGEIVEQSSEYIYEVMEDILNGKDYRKALLDNKDVNDYISELFENISSKDEVVKMADKRGQGCSTAQGFPIVLDVLLNYSDPVEAFSVNIRAGGDTAARAMIIGMILGADQGLKNLPDNLIDGFNRAGELKEMIVKL